jgi:flagellar hook assembly protein FlgD
VSDGSATGSRLQVAGDGTATVEVKNAAGEVVATYVTDVEAGWNDIAWDGMTDDGDMADDGSYTLSVTVADRAGEEITAQVYRQGEVDSIRFENNLAVLTVAGSEYYASEIAEVGL